jgi:hypothetical protein
LPGKHAALKPYLRIEHLDVDDDDPLLGPLDLDYEGVIVGLRWDFSNYATLKVEVRSLAARKDVRASGCNSRSYSMRHKAGATLPRSPPLVTADEACDQHGCDSAGEPVGPFGSR